MLSLYETFCVTFVLGHEEYLIIKSLKRPHIEMNILIHTTKPELFPCQPLLF